MLKRLRAFLGRKNPAAEAGTASSVPQPLQTAPTFLHPKPETFSIEWERKQLQGFAAYDAQTGAGEQLARMEEEILHRQIAYVKSVADRPLVQAYLLQHLPPEHGITSPCPFEDLDAAWVHCWRKNQNIPGGYSPEEWRKVVIDPEPELTPAQKELAERIEPSFSRLLSEYRKARHRLEQIREQVGEETAARRKQQREAEWQAYREHIDTLTDAQKQQVYQAAYGLAVSGCQSDFLEKKRMLPFAYCGLTDYGDPDQTPVWMGKAPVFQIVKLCFQREDPLLYWKGGWRGIEDAEQYARTIINHSSGIGGIEVLQIRDGAFTFRLDAAAHREEMSVGGTQLRPAADGLYLLTVPCRGRFDCELGEIVDGREIPLYHQYMDTEMDLYHQMADPIRDGR